MSKAKDEAPKKEEAKKEATEHVSARQVASEVRREPAAHRVVTTRRGSPDLPTGPGVRRALSRSLPARGPGRTFPAGAGAVQASSLERLRGRIAAKAQEAAAGSKTPVGGDLLALTYELYSDEVLSKAFCDWACEAHGKNPNVDGFVEHAAKAVVLLASV